MGEVADTMTKKKKKGRPSLLDLQKRAIKQQQLQQQQQQQNRNQDVDNRSGSKNPNSNPRSKRRNPNPNGVSSEDDDERREKKHKLLHGLNSQFNRHSFNSQLDGSDLIPGGSDYTGGKVTKVTDILQGSLGESGPTTPLPDKKLLVFILDRLQKKDTYGVYSDPVDPEELPDYHEIITNPMDFTTLRKKLDSGAYTSLEQFESDVFLICANAMEYNSADTVYYRQARAIQELAKKDFENLRRESDDEEELLPNQQQQQQQQQDHEQQQQQPPKPRRGRPPKNKSEPSSIDRTPSEISIDALLPGGDNSNSRFSGVYNLRKTPPLNKFRQAETSVRINHNSETQQSAWSVDWEKEFPPSVVKAVNKYGMKHFNVDDNRRDTYNNLSSSSQEPSVLTTLEDELKQLIPVGLNTEYGYARSLARYAANLGPVAWKIASRRIETVLPSGVKFGQGWVGENPAGPEQVDDDLTAACDDHSNRIMPSTATVSSGFIGNRHESSQGIEETTPLTEDPSSSSCVKPESSNGLSHNSNQMLGMLRQQQPKLTKEVIPVLKQEFHRYPPDLNTRLVSPNSPSSNLQQTGSSSSQQHPDLALQL